MTMLIESVQTPLSRAEAFAYIADWSRQSEWDPNTTSSRQIGEGEPGVGSRYALEVKSVGRSVPMEYRITEYEPPSRLVLIGEGSGIWTEDVLTFSETPEGTRVDYQAEIKLSGVLGVVQPLLGRAFDGIAKGAVGGMKQQLDALAASAEPAA
jgi:hypothetical protein